MSSRSPRAPSLAMLLGPAAALMLMAAAVRAGVPHKDAEILIHSQPEGATVMVLGKTWGVTPMRLQLKEAFPALYRPEQPYIGMAIYLSKEGCSEFRQPIHRRNVPAEIHADLDCEPSVNAAAASSAAIAPAASGAPPAAVPAPPARQPSHTITSSVRKKLEELEELRKAGLVTEQEYQKLRKRILDYF